MSISIIMFCKTRINIFWKTKIGVLFCSVFCQKFYLGVLFCVLQNRTEHYCSRTCVLCSFIPGLELHPLDQDIDDVIRCRWASQDQGNQRTPIQNPSRGVFWKIQKYINTKYKNTKMLNTEPKNPNEWNPKYKYIIMQIQFFVFKYNFCIQNPKPRYKKIPRFRFEINDFRYQKWLK